MIVSAPASTTSSSVDRPPANTGAKRLIVESSASSCYFRTSVGGDGRKALVQITERCDLHCAHCFVSSTAVGQDMSLEQFRDVVLPRLVASRVERVTLTGGEPTIHPEFLAICESVVVAGLPLAVCTNGAAVTAEMIATLAGLGDVHVNISFDGFRTDTHGKFRGNRASFDRTVATARMCADAGILQGLLSTPNLLTEPGEFAELCDFALELGAKYVLMNPLSSFGRGVKSKGRLAAPADMMRAIRAATDRFADQLDRVLIRFPNEGLPLGGCDAGKLVYVFTDGEMAVCPYLAFAARTPISQHADREFMVGNILAGDVAGALDGYDFHARYPSGTNPTCGSCAIHSSCGKGCPAAVVANGGRIGEVDAEQCPTVDGRKLLPLAVAS
ncbi:radical SAM protein [Longispora sp. NPDC051575]|uniref:radical SAM protein n=1 Tax=Longispora sp. NPDC051575 TaxID=3154943 RepID=UPI003437A9C5